MIAFWMMTGLAAALAALLVLTGARRGADPAAGAETQAGSREIEELDRLKARGLLYPCFCTRGDIAAAP